MVLGRKGEDVVRHNDSADPYTRISSNNGPSEGGRNFQDYFAEVIESGQDTTVIVDYFVALQVSAHDHLDSRPTPLGLPSTALAHSVGTLGIDEAIGQDADSVRFLGFEQITCDLMHVQDLLCGRCIDQRPTSWLCRDERDKP